MTAITGRAWLTGHPPVVVPDVVTLERSRPGRLLIQRARRRRLDGASARRLFGSHR